MRSDQDPFEGLRLDDGFVRAARFIEPSAADRERAGSARRPGRCQVAPAHRGLPGVFHRIVWPPRPRRRRRVKGLAVLALALGMISLGVFLLRQNVGRAGQAGVVANPAAGPEIEVTATSQGEGLERVPQPATGPGASVDVFGLTVPASVVASAAPGDCLAWAQAVSATVAAQEVACSAPHRAEVVSVVDLATGFPNWPARADALDTLATTKCWQAAEDYATAQPPGFDPLLAGSLHVGKDAWQDDLRVLVCVVGNQRGTPWSGSVHTSEPAGGTQTARA